MPIAVYLLGIELIFSFETPLASWQLFGCFAVTECLTYLQFVLLFILIRCTSAVGLPTPMLCMISRRCNNYLRNNKRNMCSLATGILLQEA